MERGKQIKLAKQFKDMHRGKLFSLPNAWNGGSAKVFEKQGFKAIGTTSAGIAYSMGYADGERIEFDDLIRVTKEIIRSVNIPLTVDLERGYGETFEDIKENVKKIILLGAVGINIEDGFPSENSVDEMECFIEKIRTIASLKKELGIDFVINARTDIYLLNVGDKDTKLENTIKRAKSLKEAGADCIFIPGALDEPMITELKNNIELPINLFVHTEFNDVERLNEIGIIRLSSGSAPVRTVFEKLIYVSDDFKNNKCESMLNHGFTYGVANTYFEEK